MHNKYHMCVCVCETKSHRNNKIKISHEFPALSNYPQLAVVKSLNERTTQLKSPKM